MQIWISNTRSNQAYDREFFAELCDSLVLRRGALRVTKEFQSLLALALLPWLDQPRYLEPARLISEIHEAWAELWTLRASDLSNQSSAAQVMPRSIHANGRNADGEQILGAHLARPLHALAAFAASGGDGSRLRVGTHRQLVDAHRGQGWRVIQGGAAR